MTNYQDTISRAIKSIAEADVLAGTMNRDLYLSSPAYKKEWNRCNLIDLQVLIETERGMKPNKTLYNADATYTKIRDKRDFERIKQNFERKYA